DCSGCIEMVKNRFKHVPRENIAFPLQNVHAPGSVLNHIDNAVCAVITRGCINLCCPNINDSAVELGDIEVKITRAGIVMAMGNKQSVINRVSADGEDMAVRE